MGLAIVFSSVNLATPMDPDPTSYPDVVAIPPPTFTLRNLLTGEPVTNQHYGQQSEKNIHWELMDITIKNQRMVQFRVPDTQKCFTGSRVEDCSETGLTSFFLVPTDTGAFIIQRAFVDGACFVSRNFGDFQFEQCLRGLPKAQDLPFLWALVPPFGSGKLLKPPMN
ncbi:hypothetical protein A1D29_06825 [Pasteurellaceae bacterium Orientalotternb1]|nr:hypothetical protein A1D29_06825 [Pasteurellaceae bacterium Orientalotternb1]